MSHPEPTSNRSRFSSRVPLLNLVGVAAVVLAGVLITAKNLPDNTANQLLNVSYDPTVEVYAALDKAFTQQYRAQTGVTLDIEQSHGGSGRQARAVVDGTEKADVVSLALISDIDILSKRDHGTADARRFDYVALYIIRGLQELHLEFTAAS